MAFPLYKRSLLMSAIRSTSRAGVPAVSTPGSARAAVARPLGARDGFDRPVSGPRVETKLQTLRRGMTGPSIAALQQKLVAAGFMSKADARSGPGVYGPRTEAAVRRLQESVGSLSVDGVAGPGTLAALAAGARPRPPIDRTPTDASIQQPVELQAIQQSRPADTLTDEDTDPMARP